MATAATVVIRMDGDSATLIRELNKANRQTNSTFRRMGKEATKMAAQFAVIAGAAATAFAALTRHSFQSIDALAKTADRLGITTEALATMQTAASLAGVDTEKLNKSLVKQQKAIVDAQRGLSTYARAFDELGLKTSDLLELDADQQFAVIAEALNNVENATRRNAIAMDIWGARSVEMINFAQEAAGGLGEMRELLDDLNVTVSRFDASKIEQANDAVEIAQKGFEGLGNTIAVAVAPYVTALAKQFTDAGRSSKGFKNEVDAAVDGILKAAGFAADGILGIKIAFDGVSIVVLKFREVALRTFAAIIDNIPGLKSGIRGMLNNLADFTEHFVGFGGAAGEIAKDVQQALRDAAGSDPVAGLRAAADEASKTAADLATDIEKSLNGELPSTAIKKWAAEARAAAEQAAAEMEQALKRGAQGGGGAPIAAPANLDTSALLAQTQKAAEARLALERATTAEISRIVISGEKALTGELGRLIEERARIATDAAEREARAQAAASGTDVQFDREKEHAKNRLQIARDTVTKLLNMRRTVVDAGWFIDLRVNADTGALTGLQQELTATREKIAEAEGKRLEIIAALADPQGIDRQLADLKAKLADVEPIAIGADTAKLTAAERRISGLAAQIDTLNERRLTIAADSPDLVAVDEQISALRGDLAQTMTARVELQGAADAVAEATALRDQIAALESRRLTVSLVTQGAEVAGRQIEVLKTELEAVEATRINLAVDSTEYAAAGDQAQRLRAEIADLEGRELRVTASIAGLQEIEPQLAALRSELDSLQTRQLELTVNTDAYADAGDQIATLQGQIAALENRRVELVVGLDSAPVQREIAALDAQISELYGRLANPPAIGAFTVDFSAAVNALAQSGARQADLAQQSAEEIRRIVISGEQQISQDLANIIEARSQAIVAAEQRQAELRAALTGSTAVFDAEKALGEARVRVANETADALIDARDRATEIGAINLPTVDTGAIRAQTEAATQQYLAAWQLANQQRLDADLLLQQTMFANESSAGQQLIALAAQQAREKVLAEFAARQAQLSELGQTDDPETRAAFEKAVRDETLAKEAEFLNERLQLQQQFGHEYIQLQRSIASVFTDDWAKAHKKGLQLTAVFAASAMRIAGAMFSENKAVAAALAIINTAAAVTLALRTIPPPASFAVAAATAAEGYAQLQAIRSTTIGGGGIGGGLISGGATIPSTSATNFNGTSDQSGRQVTVVFEGDFYGFDDYTRSKIIDAIKDAVDDKDVVIFSGNSRQAREIREGG